MKDSPEPPPPPWKVLVVDDEPAVHQVTRLALRGAQVLGRPLQLLHAESAEAARRVLVDERDIALALLDVVMETDAAGLELVRHIRDDLGNRTMRIVLRTGQPGQAPERSVLVDYDINDYKEKTELSATKLYTLVTVGIRAWRDLRALEATRLGLQAIAQASTALYTAVDLPGLAAMALKLARVLPFCEGGALLTVQPDRPDGGLDPERIARIGDFVLDPERPGPEWAAIKAACKTPDRPVRIESVLADARTLGPGLYGVSCLRARADLDADEQLVFDVFARNVATACEAVLRRIEAHSLARLPEELDEPLARVSAEARVLYANAAAQPLLAHLQTRVGEPLREPWAGRLREVIALQRRVRTEIEFGGRIVELVVTPVEGAAYANLTLRDVTEFRHALSRLEHAAFHDALTGLRNRSHFRAALDDALARARAEQRTIGLVLIDIDQFQQINDSYGHAGGDEAIRAIARRLGYMVRPGDLLARLGGDEFGVLVAGLEGAQELPGLVERLRAGLAKQLLIGAQPWYPSCSFGIAAYPRDAAGGEDLLRCAEMAMVRSKREGPGSVTFYDGEMHTALRRRAGVALQLREALERRALVVHYQPVLRLADRRVVGAEALVRVPLPDGRLLPPVEFIPVAEETGLIDELGDQVLRTALRDFQAWHDAGHDELRVAVNMSGRQLRDPRIAERVARAVEDTGYSARHLEIELTESMLIGDAGGVLQRLWQLRELGATLAIDDFGTGYSSLAYLRRLPVGKLKIDRSFVADLPGNTEALQIIDTVLALARSLRLEVVAEGVESEAQAQLLNRLGCDLAQGYGFSRPVPAHEFERLLQQHKEVA